MRFVWALLAILLASCGQGCVQPDGSRPCVDSCQRHGVTLEPEDVLLYWALTQ